MGFNVFTLFVGFGAGSLAFQFLLESGFGTALVIFGVIAALAAVAAIPLFADEGHPAALSGAAAPAGGGAAPHHTNSDAGA